MYVCACLCVTAPELLVRKRVVFTATEEELISFMYNVIFPSALIRLANANTTTSTVQGTGATISCCFATRGDSCYQLWAPAYLKVIPLSPRLVRNWAENAMLAGIYVITCKDQNRRLQSSSGESLSRGRQGRGRRNIWSRNKGSYTD